MTAEAEVVVDGDTPPASETSDLAEDVLRGLAAYLGVGGYNSETFDAGAFDRKVRDGIALLTAPMEQAFHRYNKLRSIGAAPAGTLHLEQGRVMVATNLDAWLDEYLEKGRPPAPSHAVELRASPPPASETSDLAEENKLLREALTDMLAGWRYIRQNHGDLYGVGWDRAQQKAEAALRASKGESHEAQ